MNIYEQLNKIDDEQSLSTYVSENTSLIEAVTLRHSEYFCSLPVDEQIDITNQAQAEIEKQTDLIFESRKFRHVVNTRPELTKLSNQDLILFCKPLGYTVLKIKSSEEKDSFIAYITSHYTKM